MKQVCLHCTRQAPVGSLWCQEVYCATDDKPVVLEPGESLGDIGIVRLVAVLRTAAVYEADRAGTRILLKVAHDGLQERLKREAVFLVRLQQRNVQHPALPVLLPAYAQTDVASFPCGKAVVGGQTMYYAALRHTPGELLRDVLLQESQPWYQYAGWLALMVADVVALMHRAQRLHLCLSPESILIRYDRERTPRPVLLDLGAVTRPEKISRNWQRSFVPPAYLAPEFLDRNRRKFGAFTDVYGLGLILYEMLAGQPAYPHRLRAATDIYHDVLNRPPALLNRPDLKNLPGTASRAISKDYRRRQPHVLGLAEELQANLPPVPKEKKTRPVDWRTAAIILGAALAIAFLLVLALSLGQAIG